MEKNYTQTSSKQFLLLLSVRLVLELVKINIYETYDHRIEFIEIIRCFTKDNIQVDKIRERI